MYNVSRYHNENTISNSTVYIRHYTAGVETRETVHVIEMWICQKYVAHVRASFFKSYIPVILHEITGEHQIEDARTTPCDASRSAWETTACGYLRGAIVGM